MSSEKDTISQENDATEKVVSNPKTDKAEVAENKADVSVKDAKVFHSRVVVDGKLKRKALETIIKKENLKKSVIFCNRKRSAGMLNRSLSKKGFAASEIFKGMPEENLEEIISAFSEGKTDFIVCSDAALKKVDIKGVSCVINFDVPMHSKDYLRRADNIEKEMDFGKIITISTERDAGFIGEIEKISGKKVEDIVIETEEKTEARTFSDNKKSDQNKKFGKDKKEETSPENKKADFSRENTDENASKSHKNRKRNDPASMVEVMTHADNVRGFGDHTPAFILKKTVLGRRRRKQETKTQ